MYSEESNGWSGEERGETNDSREEGKKASKKEKTQGGVQQVEKTIIDTNMMVLCVITGCRIYDTVRAKYSYLYNIVGKEGRACWGEIMTGRKEWSG